MSSPKTNKVDRFILHPEVLRCLHTLEAAFGTNGERLVISDVLDEEGHQYVNLVQKGGGVLGVALVGYTYILEQMGIRFMRLAGTSAGAINTALMTVIGAAPHNENGLPETTLQGNKKIPKSKDILDILARLDFFKLVDGHPAARRLIKWLITNKDFSKQLRQWLTALLLILVLLPLISFVCLGLQYQIPSLSYVTKALFVLTGIYMMLLSILMAYSAYLLQRLKDAGFGINPGDYFYDWIKEQLHNNHVYTVTDLMTVASTPVSGLHLRGKPGEQPADLTGDVTFIASEIVSMNKIEFPLMWNLFRKHPNELQPAGFVRASMAIPVFFESYFINNIPCNDDEIRKAWLALGEQEPPSVARFVDGGILSNFPLNLFFNPAVEVPRLPSLGIDLDDEKDAQEMLHSIHHSKAKNTGGKEGMNPDKWSFGGYLYRIFNTVRFYYDKDFLIKNIFFRKGIGTVPLKGFNWLNFLVSEKEKQDMFVLGARAATSFLLHFDWEDYKRKGKILRQDLKTTDTTLLSANP